MVASGPGLLEILLSWFFLFLNHHLLGGENMVTSSPEILTRDTEGPSKQLFSHRLPTPGMIHNAVPPRHSVKFSGIWLTNYIISAFPQRL